MPSVPLDESFDKVKVAPEEQSREQRHGQTAAAAGAAAAENRQPEQKHNQVSAANAAAGWGTPANKNITVVETMLTGDLVLDLFRHLIELTKKIESYSPMGCFTTQDLEVKLALTLKRAIPSELVEQYIKAATAEDKQKAREPFEQEVLLRLTEWISIAQEELTAVEAKVAAEARALEQERNRTSVESASAAPAEEKIIEIESFLKERLSNLFEPLVALLFRKEEVSRQTARDVHEQAIRKNLCLELEQALYSHPVGKNLDWVVPAERSFTAETILRHELVERIAVVKQQLVEMKKAGKQSVAQALASSMASGVGFSSSAIAGGDALASSKQEQSQAQQPPSAAIARDRCRYVGF
jgi:hypothetical protein